jgi:hypothetical protein
MWDMKREEGVGVESVRIDEVSSSQLFPFGVAKEEASQLEALRLENAGLRRLVAELLVANQQLRERLLREV